jgi:SAM-dependent methyltransferase
MTNYAGRYAELYDLFYADKPYAEEVRCVHEFIQEFGRRSTREILELACGTGRHAAELEKFGYQVTAIDHSPDMIDIARRRAINNGSKIVFAIGDMQHFELPAKEYDAAVCLFDSIGYLKTDKAIAKTFARIRDRLRPNGVFVFEFWHAPAMLNHYSPLRVRKWKIANSEIVRTSETTLDRENRLANVRYTVDERNDDGTCSQLYESHTNRFFSVEEMKTLVSCAKFDPVKFFAGFDMRTPVNDDTWHILAVARKT